MCFYKKTGAVLTAAIMGISMLGLTGCKNSGGEENTADTSAAETEAAPSGVLNNDWSYGQVAISGGGFVTGIINTCEGGLFYARTDVGGAYRWDGDRWTSLSLDVSDDDKGFLGIDGIAADPKNAANLYMVAGTSYFSNGRTCIMISHDYGEHFERVEVTDLIKVHGNGMGRGNGERIAVDPNNSDIIYCGGRTGGMIRSTDGGRTWEKVSSFPVESTKNENGVNIILFDKDRVQDGRTSRIYAGISESKTDNVFYSDDGGETWNAVAADDKARGYMPQRFDIDSLGDLYVSYGNKEGPWNSVEGTLYRYCVDDKTSEELEVVSNTVGDIVIDPANDNNILLVTSEVWTQQPNGAYGDKFYRSTDAGKTWEDLEGKYTMSANGMDWISNAAIHWCSVLAMDSGNSNRVLVNSGNGIFACDNIWDENPEFYFESRGIEETVPLDIVTYKDHPLVSAVGDYDGFIHEDIHTPAQRHSLQIGTCTSIAIAAKNHDIWAKVGNDESRMQLFYSLDGGQNWNSINRTPESGKVLYGGHLALTADGSALIWRPANGMFAYRTENWGEEWTKVEGIIGSQEVYLAGDNVNKDYVYACAKGKTYVSSDGGKSFTKKNDAESRFDRIAVSPDAEGTFYVPADGMGLLKTTDHGDSFTRLDGLRLCEAVGLGKPKKDGDPYVIYVSGTPKDSDTKGLYMSEDDGVTWVRINDDLHRFGGIGNGKFVSGDMNVYGRCYMSTVGLGIAYCDKNEK